MEKEDLKRIIRVVNSRIKNLEYQRNRANYYTTPKERIEELTTDVKHYNIIESRLKIALDGEWTFDPQEMELLDSILKGASEYFTKVLNSISKLKEYMEQYKKEAEEPVEDQYI